MNDTRIRNTLAAFLFTGDDVFKRVSDLSGGEKGRLSLAKLMLSGANFLVLDEPTNHLDILGKEVLEDALQHYEGTLLFVSHDRYFIEQVAGRIWDLSDEQIYDYIGDYEYYLTHVEERRTRVTTQRVKAAEMVQKSWREADDSRAGDDTDGLSGKLSWEEQKRERAARQKAERDLADCEATIARLEERERELAAMVADPQIATDGARLREIAEEQAEIAEQLAAEMERWETLAE